MSKEKVIAGMPESLVQKLALAYFENCIQIATHIAEYGSTWTLTYLENKNLTDEVHGQLRFIQSFRQYIDFKSIGLSQGEFDDSMRWCQTLWNDINQMLQQRFDAVREREIVQTPTKQKKMIEARPGYIYLIKSVTPKPYYKIGLSKTPVERIDRLDVILPFPIEPLHQFPTNHRHKAEKVLHKLYGDKRVNGEWFALSEQDIADICAIERMDIEGVQL